MIPLKDLPKLLETLMAFDAVAKRLALPDQSV
jgi:hypothetical protein